MEAPESFRRNRLIVAATLVAAAVLLFSTVLRPPIVGLADNGDFSRILHPAGLAHTSERYEERYFGWIQPRFALAPPSPDPGGYRTSETLLARAAVFTSRLVSGGPFFDIRFLGAIHMLLLLSAMGILVAAFRELSAVTQCVGAILLVFFFTDIGYTALFNSLYSQTASLLFLLLTAAVAAEAIRRGGLDGLLLPAYFLCALLFVCSKPQESVQGPLLAVFGLRLAWAHRRSPLSRAAGLALALALCALSWRYFRSAERAMGALARYSILFLEILPRSPDPAADLAELGLDPSWARYACVDPWGSWSPFASSEFRAHFQAGSEHPSPRSLYLRHPGRLEEVLVRTARVSGALQSAGLGNFARETGAPWGQKAAWPAAWSALRLALWGPLSLAALFCGNLAVIAVTYRRGAGRARLFREGVTLLLAMTAIAFLASALGDAHLEIERHLYLFHALCDLIVIADVMWVAQALMKRNRPSRRRAGRLNLGLPPSRRPCYPPRPLSVGL